jgi:DNA-binding winged-HTH domains
MDEHSNRSDTESVVFILDNGVKFFPDRRYVMGSAGQIINLSENSYRFLTLLLKGETDKQNIINQVWHEQRGSVSDSSYYGQIYALRKSLDMAGISVSVIKTLPRRGVKYMGKVEIIQDITSVLPTISAQPEEPLTRPDNNPLSMESSHLAQNNTLYDTGKNLSGGSRVNSRHWNLMITILAIIAVCWLSTLVVAIFIFIL